MTNKQATPAYTPETYQQLLETLLKKQKGSIESHLLDNNQRVWIRRADPHHTMWPYRLLAVISFLLGADALKPVPSLGGKAAIKNEAKTLKRLAKHHILAPTLLAQTEQGLMMSHLSDLGDLMSALKKAEKKQDIEKVFALWEIGVAAIADVHQKGQHLSQSFTRNMVLCSENTIGFIDFEDNPDDFLTLSQCQTRDWLCYLNSTAYLLDEDTSRKRARQSFKRILGAQAQEATNNIKRNFCEPSRVSQNTRINPRQ